MTVYTPTVDLAAVPPSESAAGATGRTRAERPHGAGAFAVRVAVLLALAALPVAFSAWVDPARLVTTHDAEREIARVLASRRNVTDVANYDDRAIEKNLAPMRLGRAEVLVLGSSRMQPLRAAAFGHAGFVNGAMQGGVLDDMLGVYALHDAPGRRPNRVVLGVDPWTESYTGDAGWGSLAEERALMLRRIGVPVSPLRDRLALALHAVRTVASPDYFRLAVHSFRQHGPDGITWRVTDQAQNAEKTKLPDGSVVWSALPPDNALGAARAFAEHGLAHDARFHDLAHRASGRRDALERFVRYLGDEGVSVTLVLVPFPAEVYDASQRISGDSLAASERTLRAMAARANVRVVGSYDPRAAGVETRDFFDEDHLRPEALARLVAGR
jgi:hypothetical protein